MPGDLHPLLAEVLAADVDMLRHFGMEFVAARDGVASLRTVPRSEFVNSLGVAHGSLAFTLADTAAAYAMASRGLHAATITAHVSFTSPLSQGTAAEARAEITTAGRTLATVTAIVTSQDRIVGQATFQFYILTDRGAASGA